MLKSNLVDHLFVPISYYKKNEILVLEYIKVNLSLSFFLLNCNKCNDLFSQK